MGVIFAPENVEKYHTGPKWWLISYNGNSVIRCVQTEKPVRKQAHVKHRLNIAGLSVNLLTDNISWHCIDDLECA